MARVVNTLEGPWTGTVPAAEREYRPAAEMRQPESAAMMLTVRDSSMRSRGQPVRDSQASDASRENGEWFRADADEASAFHPRPGSVPCIDSASAVRTMRYS